MARLLVLGIGNPLLTDGGAGVHAAFRLCGHPAFPPEVTVLDAGMLGVPLLPALAAADALIAIDAAADGGSPGELHVHEGAAFDRFVHRSNPGPHDAHLRALIDRAESAGQLPARRVMIAIEPETLGWGVAPSRAVAAALPRCVEVALGFIERWRGGDRTGSAAGDSVH